MSPLISADIIGDYEKFLIYADPKMGKTHTALTIPPPIYFLSVGMVNEAKVFFSKPFQDKYGNRLKPSELFVDTPKSSQEAKNMIEKALEDDYSGKGFQFRSMVVDNATRLTEMQMDVAIQLSHASKLDKNAKDVDKTAYALFEEYGVMAPYDGDWGKAQSIMRRFISELYAVEKNLVFVAHEHQDTTNDRATRTQSIVGVKPLFIGKDRTLTANMFDNVWRMTRNGMFYEARTQAGTDPKDGYKIQAGSRISGIVPPDLRDPDLSEVIKKYKAHAEKIAASNQEKAS